MKTIPTAFALLALAALPVSAAAAPPWSVPQNVSTAHVFISEPALAITGDGSALAAWRQQDGDREQTRSGERGAARAPGAAAFGAERSLPSGRVGSPVPYASSRAVLAIVRQVGDPTRDPLSDLRVAFGNAAGAFGASRRVARLSRVNSPVLAGNARGDLALAWFEERGTSNDRVYVALRRAGGVFGRPILLDTGRIRSVSTAVGPNGDVLVDWDARGVVQTRFKARSRSAFSGRETIRSKDTYFAALRTAVAANGRAYVAWGAQFRSEGGSTGPVYFEAAVRPAGSRFRAAELLEQDPDFRSANPLELVVAPDGRATVIWTGYDGQTNRVRASRTDPAGRFGAREELSRPGDDAVINDAAVGPAGQLVAAWTVFSVDQPRQVQAAFAPGGGPFGGAEEVSAREEADTAAAAFDPKTGRPTLVWVNRPAGTHGPLAAFKTYLQAAVRTG